MQNATEEAPSVWLEYVNSKQKVRTELCYFCFFEGEDRKYYVERIKEKDPSIEVFGYVCGNRKSVITVYKKILSEKDDLSSLLFFVDRDYNLDSYEDNEDVYQTPEYSIENLYCKSSVIKKIIEIEFGINPGCRDMNFILMLYDKLFSEFIHYYSSVNIWYMACKQLGLPVQINKFKPNNDVDISEGNLVLKNTHIKIHNISHYYEFLLQKDIENQKQYAEENFEKYSEKIEAVKIKIDELVLSYDSNKEFRGKFSIIFLKKFIGYIKYMNKNKLLDNMYPHVYIDEYQPNFLSSLSKYAVTPECLIKYINQRTPYLTVINNVIAE